MYRDIIVLIVVPVVIAIFGSTGFWTWLTKRSEKKSNATKLLMGLAYDKIIWQCNKYIKQGYIPIAEYNELNKYLFEPYAGEGGNGTAANKMSEVAKLPNEPPERREA